MQGSARKKLLIWHFLEGTLSNLGNSVRCLLLIMPAHKFLHLISVHLKCTLMHEGMEKLNNQETRKPKLPVFFIALIICNLCLPMLYTLEVFHQFFYNAFHAI